VTTTLLVGALVAAAAALGAVAVRSVQPQPTAVGASAGANPGSAALSQRPTAPPAEPVIGSAATPPPAGAYDRQQVPALSAGASLGGSAAARSCAQCSAGQAVDISNGSLTLDVTVPVNGYYSIGVYYVAADATTVAVSVNGESQALALEPSYDAQTPNRGSYVTAHLQAGLNTVRLASDAASGPMIDKITVQLAST